MKSVVTSTYNSVHSWNYLLNMDLTRPINICIICIVSYRCTMIVVQTTRPWQYMEFVSNIITFGLKIFGYIWTVGLYQEILYFGVQLFVYDYQELKKAFFLKSWDFLFAKSLCVYLVSGYFLSSMMDLVQCFLPFIVCSHTQFIPFVWMYYWYGKNLFFLKTESICNNIAK